MSDLVHFNPHLCDDRRCFCDNGEDEGEVTMNMDRVTCPGCYEKTRNLLVTLERAEPGRGSVPGLISAVLYYCCGRKALGEEPADPFIRDGHPHEGEP